MAGDDERRSWAAENRIWGKRRTWSQFRNLCKLWKKFNPNEDGCGNLIDLTYCKACFEVIQAELNEKVENVVETDDRGIHHSSASVQPLDCNKPTKFWLQSDMEWARVQFKAKECFEIKNPLIWVCNTQTAYAILVSICVHISFNCS